MRLVSFFFYCMHNNVDMALIHLLDINIHNCTTLFFHNKKIIRGQKANSVVFNNTHPHTHRAHTLMFFFLSCLQSALRSPSVLTNMDFWVDAYKTNKRNKIKDVMLYLNGCLAYIFVTIEVQDSPNANPEIKWKKVKCVMAPSACEPSVLPSSWLPVRKYVVFQTCFFF